MVSDPEYYDTGITNSKLLTPLSENLINDLVEAWYSLEQYIGLKEDKLSIHYCGLHQV